MEYKTERRECSIVLIGKFNPEMFSPEWFSKRGIIKDEDVNYALSKPLLVSNQLTRFVTNQLSINIELNRFTIAATKEPFIAIKDFIQSTFSNLGGFEINAYGFNYCAHYPTDSAHAYHLVGDRLAPKSFWKGLLGNETCGDDRKSGLTSIRMMKKNDNGAITMELQPSAIIEKYGLFISCNDHHNVNKEENDADDVMSNIDNQFDDSLKKMIFLQNNLLDEVLKDE